MKAITFGIRLFFTSFTRCSQLYQINAYMYSVRVCIYYICDYFFLKGPILNNSIGSPFQFIVLIFLNGKREKKEL